MKSIREVRVHGVSGTPPRDMLHTDPIPRLDGDEYARIFKKRPSHDAKHPSGTPYETEAFHWGSLTTGHWLTSLWILLAPFAFANVSGWMATSRKPLQRTAIRLAALALTGLFIAQIGYVLVGVPMLYVASAGWSETAVMMARLGSGLAWVLVFGAIVLRLSTQSHFDPLDYGDRFELLFTPTITAMRPSNHPASDHFDDPAERGVTDPALWKVHSMVHRLRRIHFAAGQLVIALVLARMQEAGTLTWLATAGLGLTVVLVVTTTYVPESRIYLGATAVITLLAEGIAIAAVILFSLSETPPIVDAIHVTTFHVAIALGIAAALSLVCGIPGIGALTIATFLGGAFGVGAGFIAEDIASVETGLVQWGGAWVAPAALIFVLFVALVAVVMTLRGPPELDRDGLVNQLLTRVTRRSGAILATAAGFGLSAGALAIVEGCLLTEGACGPEALEAVPLADPIVVVLLAVVLLVAAFRIGSYRPLVSFGLAAAASVVIWVGVTDPTMGGFRPGDYLNALPLARTLIFVGPLLAIGRSVLGAYRQGASNRKVGIIWDVASFWPRWFHPLGPPAYGPKVVTELERHLRSDGISVLAGHSQGSVIAAVAANRACEEGGEAAVGLLTYGSPIGLLYERLFPDVGMSDLIATLPARLQGGWTNLWRVDDPIGGKPLGGSIVDILDERGRGHSGYELSRAYRDARDAIASRLP